MNRRSLDNALRNAEKNLEVPALWALLRVINVDDDLKYALTQLLVIMLGLLLLAVFILKCVGL